MPALNKYVTCRLLCYTITSKMKIERYLELGLVETNMNSYMRLSVTFALGAISQKPPPLHKDRHKVHAFTSRQLQ